jgi:arginine repressor
MKYETAGDPMTGLKWTRKATRKIADELQREGIMVSDKSVSRILKELGYSLQANRKKIALSGNGSLQQRAERDLQFRHICRMLCSKARTCHQCRYKEEGTRR